MRQLPLAEQTVCLGWLLFSAPEYDRRELQRIIKETSGEDVALRYHTIQMGAKGPATKETTMVKALHMETDITLSPAQRQRITSMYSSSAMWFPLDIKMRLVPEFSAMSMPDASARGRQFLDRQARFLNRSATSTSSLANHSNLTLAQMTNLLRSTSSNYQATNQTVSPLFHAVSPMIRSTGCIIRYLPQHRSVALDTLAQLQMCLPGFQASPESLVIPSISNQQAGSEAPRICSASKQIMSKAKTWQGTGQEGSTKITLAIDWSRNPSPAPHQVANNLPQSASAHICKLMQEFIRILDQAFHSQHSRLDQDISTPTAHPPSQPQPPFTQRRQLLLRWLAAIMQLFQNTAWDQWSYRWARRR